MSNINFFRVMAGNGSQFNSQDIPCNAGSISFSGGPGVFYATAVVLGTGIGPITASFNAQGIPDRFRLVWSGSTVADSLFVGDNLNNQTNYNNYTGSISAVSSLTRKNWNQQEDDFVNDSAESVTYTSASFPPFPGSPLALTRGNTSTVVGERVNGAGNHGAQKGVLNYFPQFSSSCVDGNVKLCFFKHTTEPATFQMVIDGPDSGTGWNLFSVSCPGNDTSLHSSSIMDKDGDTAIVYHTAPSFDLDVGMTLYENSALTTKFISSGTYSTSSFWGSDKSMLVSGSSILGTSYEFDGGSGICFKNALNTGYSYITLADDAVITARSCTTSKFPTRSTAFRYGLPVGKPVFECETSRLMNVTIYFNSSNPLPANGDTVYTTATGNSYLDNGNYALSVTSRTGTPTSIITISGGSGVISAATLCIA
jgi:hypothetical protein|tara:strand:- start:1474 stop:2745 length:1272 start_codon:yes stop_codon:yes gene_type:complete